MSEHYPRYARGLILEALADTRVVLVLGARQVGKSTLTRSIAAAEHPARTLTLDDKTVRDAAQRDPKGFVAALDGPTVIDEVQRSPDLLLAIKEAVDLDQTPGRFLLTGSANILTAPRVYEALSGRTQIVNLWPLSQAEIEQTSTNLVDHLLAADPPAIEGAAVGRQAFIERAVAGGYPEARAREGKRRQTWFDSYVTAVTQRDLRDISDASKLDRIPSILKLCASQAANLFRAESIAQATHLDRKTVQSYVSLLEAVFLVRRVKAWTPNIGNREVHTPKIFITDSGLLAFLLGANAHRAAEDQQIVGKLFENFVGMEIARLADWAEQPVSLYHYRQRDDEVDIVLETASGEIACIECKAAATVTASDYKQLVKFRDARGDAFIAGFVIYTGDATVPLTDRIWAVPVSALWTA